MGQLKIYVYSNAETHEKDYFFTKSDFYLENKELTKICAQMYNDMATILAKKGTYSKGQSTTNIRGQNKQTAQNQQLKIHAEFYPYTNLKLTVRQREDKLLIRLSDVLFDAPKDVLSAAAHCILSQQLKIKCDPAQRIKYRNHIYTENVRTRIKSMRRARVRKKMTGTKGKYQDLEASFKKIKTKYYNSSLPEFNLTWSARASRGRFGHYDSDLNTIVVSKMLDNRNTPGYVIEYIIYHEILHWQFPSKFEDGRLQIHTRELKRAEKQFVEFEQAKKWLKQR